MTRRELITAGVGLAFFGDKTWDILGRLPVQDANPNDDELWAEVRRAFTIPDDILSLNHVGLCATPNRVMDAQIAALKRAARAPSYFVYREQRAELTKVKERIATFLGTQSENVALTPNATYGLQTAILGLPLKTGQKIVSTDHDYSRAWNALEQRRDRDGIELVEIVVPPDGGTIDDYIERWDKALTPDVGLAVLCSITYLIGQVIPYERIISLCQQRGIPVLIDTAQSVGLRPFSFDQSEAEYMTACLHKWVMGPVGSGVFCVQTGSIEGLWPLAPPAPQFRNQIIKFEQYGTFPFANFLALDAALDFHEWIGMERKSDRLFVLRRYLHDEIADIPGIKFYSSLDRSRHDGMLTLSLRGLSGGEIARRLFQEHRIHVTTSLHNETDGIRVSPHIFMTLKDMDRMRDSLTSISVSSSR